MGVPFGVIDEFQITATSSTKETRIWTRSYLNVSKFIADQAISRLGYDKAEVVNTYGGVVSDPLYVVEKIHNSHS